VLQGSILGPVLFLEYINDLPKAIKCKALPILFADDTSILLTSPNNIQTHSDLNFVFEQLNKWFKSNQYFFLNFDKTYFIQFSYESKFIPDIQIKYEDKQLNLPNETKFLRLFINNNLSWKTHIECIKSKLSSPFYAMSSKTICNNKYLENDLLFLFPLCNDLWFVILGELPRQYKEFQVAKEDY